MEKRKQAPERRHGTAELALRLQGMQGPEIQESLDKLRQRYAKHAVPVEQVRDMLDRALGSQPLTDELYKLRGK